MTVSFGGQETSVSSVIFNTNVWVESLPLTKTVESAESVIHVLESINRSKMGVDERVELLEIYRPVINVLLDELDAIYAYSPLPLPAKQLQAFQLSHRLLVESGYAYKMLLVEKTGKMIVLTPRKTCRCRFIARCVFCDRS